MDFMPQVISGSDEELDRGCEDGMTFNEEMIKDEIPPCQLEEKDIFNDLEENHSPVNVAGTTEQEPEPEPEPIKMKVVKEEPKATKPKQKRRMTEKQREALEKNRAKAIETRKRNAKARRELKELEKKKKQMDLDKLREEVNGKPKVEKVVEFVEVKHPQGEKPVEIKEKPKPKAIKTFTQDEVNEITFTAIKNYDMIKKARKIEKQEKQKKEREEQLERDRLLKIVNRQNSSNNFWDHCF